MRVSIFVALVAFPSKAAAADCKLTPNRTIGTHYHVSKATRQPGDLDIGVATRWIVRGRVEEARFDLVLQPNSD